MIEPGETIDGKYRVEHVLGRGGMGAVFVATHAQLDQRVAIKVMHDASDPVSVTRFLREARASVRLTSEHVCKVFDVGQLDSGAPYIVMELLDGEDLARVIRSRPLDPATAADYVLQACVALVEAHALGIVHRDLKPSNLFLAARVGRSPMIKVLDFGIAKAPSAGEADITNTAAMLGSPGYMSPEQLRSTRDADARSDIWSLGVILYELVSGRRPFTGDTFGDLVVKVAVDPPDPFDAPEPYAAIVMRCLDKQPERRYASVADLARELEGCASPTARGLSDVIGGIARSRQSAPPARLDPREGVATQATGTPAPPPRKAPARRRALPLAIGAVAIAGAAVAGTLALTSRASSQTAPLPARVDAAIQRADAGVVASVNAADKTERIDAGVAVIDAAASEDPEARCARLERARRWNELVACATHLPGTTGEKFLTAAKAGRVADARTATLAQAHKLADAHECIALGKLQQDATPELAAELRRIDCVLEHCDPDLVATRERDGRSDFMAGRYPPALIAFQGVLDCRPDDKDLMTDIVISACRSGQRPLARMVWVRLGSPKGLEPECVSPLQSH